MQRPVALRQGEFHRLVQIRVCAPYMTTAEGAAQFVQDMAITIAKSDDQIPLGSVLGQIGQKYARPILGLNDQLTTEGDFLGA